MNKETIELINRLADKLGTTAEHLWGVLIVQARINAYEDIAILAFWGAASLLFSLLFWKANKDEWEYTDVIVGVWIVVLICAGIYGLMAVPEIITCLANPEYWALQQILPRH